nr:hypothetical protein [Tanacetum cinerariifolium]
STTPPTPTPTTTVESAPRLSATAKGKQPSRATTPVEPTDVQRTKAKRLKIVLRKSRQETHISQQRGSGTDEGTSSKPGEEETRQEEDENFDPIPRTPEESEEESNNEEEKDLRLSEEARIQEEEDADELYRDERLRSLETSFSEYRQTNQFADAVSAILDIVHQYMDQQMKEAVREAV